MQPRASLWRKSTRCHANNGCVEVAELADSSAIGVRDSKFVAASPVLQFRSAEWADFTQRVKAGDYDLTSGFSGSVAP